MIKSAIKHSAIRSAIRKPFIASDDGYREYLKRSVFEFNGTQWGELSEPVVLDGDFEIEMFITGDLFGDSTQSLFSGVLTEDPWLYVNGVSNGNNVALRYDSGSGFQYLSNPAPFKDGKIHRITLTRIGATVSLGIDGDEVSRSINIPFVLNNLYASRSGTSLGYGNIFSIRNWKNGNRNTGELILNVPFDESGSDYQRNRAVAQGVELYSDSFALPEFFSRDGNIITKTGTTSGTIFIANVEAGKQYKLSFRKDSHSAGSPNLRDQFNNQYVFPLMSTLESSGKTYEFLFTATTDGQVGINGTSSLWSVSELSIREWSGIILQNALPEDWMQIEKKRYWDYWREVGNESNILEIAS